MATKTLEQRVKAFCRTAQKQLPILRALAVECLEHAATHGDATAMLRLIQGLPTSYRVEALVLWIEAFSPVRFGKDENGVRVSVGILKKDAKKYVPFNLTAAKATPFDTFSKENETKPLDYAALERIITAFESRYNKAKEEGKVVAEDDDRILARLSILKQAMAAPIPMVAAAALN